MVTNSKGIQDYLKEFDFEELFVDELGWNRLRNKERPFTITHKEQDYNLRLVAEKQGVKVYLCDPDEQGQIPDDARLRAIDREVTKYANQHLIIYIDAAHENQTWQWVRRRLGKPIAMRLKKFHKSQAGTALAQQLRALEVSLQEELSLTHLDVTGRVEKAFDVEKVTKRFYDHFQKEHTIFKNLITGIHELNEQKDENRAWYTSVMLNRLMFIYFIQRQGFLNTKSDDALDGDTDYLRDRLHIMQQQNGSDQFHSFYRYFLLRLFHDGLSKREHSPEMEKLLGKVPYLNGGLFDVHILERENTAIEIPDSAFERIFDFFDEFNWHLDDRPLHKDNEINPDVLGYIFEKYINQKQMGAYYTKAEVVGTDEAFFEDDPDSLPFLDLYNEKAGILDGEADSEVDLASQAYQIWKNATDADPKLKSIIEKLPNVAFSTRAHQPSALAPEGVLVYMRTAEGNDSLAWMNRKGESVTQSQLAILRAAACDALTKPMQRPDDQHELVRKGVEHIISEETHGSGGQLGSPSGARLRTYMRLKHFIEVSQKTLFPAQPELHNAVNEIYNYPLQEGARDTLNRQIRSGISDYELGQLVVRLRDENLLCHIHEETEPDEPQIICSLGLFESAGGV